MGISLFRCRLRLICCIRRHGVDDNREQVLGMLIQYCAISNALTRLCLEYVLEYKVAK